MFRWIVCAPPPVFLKPERMPRRRDVKKNGCSKHDEEWFKHGQKNDCSTHDPKRRRMVKKKEPERLIVQTGSIAKKKTNGAKPDQNGAKADHFPNMGLPSAAPDGNFNLILCTKSRIIRSI